MIPITMSPAMLSKIRSAASDMFFLHRAVLLARRGIRDNGTEMAVTKLPTKKYDILRCGVSHVLGKSTPRLECDQGLVYAVNPWLRVCGGGFLGLSPLRGRYAGWGAAVS